MIENTVANDLVSDVNVGPSIVAVARDGDIPPSTIDAIVRMTNELVPGELRIEVSVDPEFPERPSLVFHVRQQSRSLSVEEEIDRELEWHARAGIVAPQSQDRLRLLLA